MPIARSFRLLGQSLSLTALACSWPFLPSAKGAEPPRPAQPQAGLVAVLAAARLARLPDDPAAFRHVPAPGGGADEIAAAARAAAEIIAPVPDLAAGRTMAPDPAEEPGQAAKRRHLRHPRARPRRPRLPWRRRARRPAG